MISEPEERRESRREKRQQTRTALLDAAERLWADRGIRGASLDEIAGQAGMTKGAVYSNFSSKTDLLLALLERYTQADLGLELGPRPHEDAEDSEQAAVVGREYARLLDTDEARRRAMLLVELWLFGMRDFSAGWRIADWYHQHRERLAAELADQAGGMPAAERASLAMAIDFGLAFQHLLDPDRVPAELYAAGMRLALGTCPQSESESLS